MPEENTNYKSIVDHYEKCLDEHGDSHLGVDWPNREDAEKRYEVMLGLSQFTPSTGELKMLDFGCGAAHLYEYMRRNSQWDRLRYQGMDISEKFVELARSKFPDLEFHVADVLKDSYSTDADLIVMNGVFTEKRDLSFEEMWDYFKSMIKWAFGSCNRGIAFNVMSKNVDWEREDLFHLPHDMLTAFLCDEISRDYIIRNDYGLYEYTTYVLKRS